MDRIEIEKLLEKYWECETNPEEEETLYRFFAEEEELPPHLAKYKDFFVVKQEETTAALNESFDERILAILEEEQSRSFVRKNRRIYWQVVASIAAIFIIWLATDRYIVYNDPWQQETFETPEEALAEVQKVFSTVSEHLEKGQGMVVRNMEKVEPMTKIIK